MSQPPKTCIIAAVVEGFAPAEFESGQNE